MTWRENTTSGQLPLVLRCQNPILDRTDNEKRHTHPRQNYHTSTIAAADGFKSSGDHGNPVGHNGGYRAFFGNAVNAITKEKLVTVANAGIEGASAEAY